MDDRPDESRKEAGAPAPDPAPDLVAVTGTATQTILRCVNATSLV
jgi:hypothetical protein